jgi:hypothetical protein
LEARIQTKVTSRNQIRILIRIKVMRICNTAVRHKKTRRRKVLLRCSIGVIQVKYESEKEDNCGNDIIQSGGGGVGGGEAGEWNVKEQRETGAAR